MTEAELTLVDARAQVKAALEEMESDLSFTVRQSYPREAADGVVVTYGEYDNRSTDCPVVDEITYQVDIWAFDRETAAALTDLVNRAMLGIGLKRTYMGPDVVENSTYERKTLRFGRRVDKRTMRLIN
ncbi:MAG: hypothetical protein LUD84_07470 [Clostridiales bacterium]|nr:hypothetical protein [Clostridiales bacterium]